LSSKFDRGMAGRSAKNYKTVMTDFTRDGTCA
jgi:hypothetical protein